MGVTKFTFSDYEKKVELINQVKESNEVKLKMILCSNNKRTK